MSQKRLKPWQKATALVPLALLSGAWTTSLTVTDSASAADRDKPTLPDGSTVPDQAIEAPASMSQPGSVAPGVPADAADSVIANASVTGIPDAALAAYQRAAQVINTADASCNLSWELVAAIGRVESDHGRYGGNRLGDDGRSRPGVYGIPLDGSDGTARIRDTDAGELDDDQVWDRAVGPMQFIPSTWQVVGVDADGDGVRDPQDIDDAALATAVYLCSGDEDLATTPGQRAAVYRYNHSQQYVDLVLSIMTAYLDGDFSSVPNTAAGTTVLVPASGKAEASAAGKKKAGKKSGRAGDGGGTGSSSGGSGSSGSGTSGGGGGGSTTPDGGDVTSPPTGGGSDPVETVEETTKKVTDEVEDTTKDVTDTTKETTEDTLTYAEAKAQCIAEGVSTLNLAACIEDLLNG